MVGKTKMERENLIEKIYDNLNDASDEEFIGILDGFVMSKTDLIDQLGGLDNCSDEHLESISITMDLEEDNE